MILANYVKRGAHIIKQRIYYDNIISTVANLLSVTKTTEEYTESIFKDIISLTYDTLKDAFIHMDGKISDFPDLKKQTVTLDIERRWGKDITEERARKTT